MNPLILLAQAFFDNQAKLQAQNLKAAGLRAAEAGRRMAIAGVFFATAGAFFFSGLLVAIVDIGLQIDRAHTVQFSGLMVSALMLVTIGLFAIFCGWLSARESEQPPVAQEALLPPQNELRSMLEAVAIAMLKEFLDSRNRKHTETRSNDSTEAETT